VVKRLHLAKTSKLGAPQISIRKHSDSLLECFRQFLLLFPDVFTPKDIEIIRYACEKHDVGKYNIKFQNRMMQIMKMGLLADPLLTMDELRHELISLLAVNEMDLSSMGLDEAEKTILTNCIALHHGKPVELSPDILDRLENVAATDLRPLLPAIQKDFPDIKALEVSKKLLDRYGPERIWKLRDKSSEAYLRYIKLKGTVNRLDYAASAGLTNIEIDGIDEDTLKTLNEMVYDTLMGKYGGLRDIQQYMYDHKDENLIVIGATGIGKTEGCLLWQDGVKSFYTLPLKVAINAIYERIATKGKDCYDYSKASLLHSDVVGYYMDKLPSGSSADLDMKVSQTRKLQAPLTVTTVDQLFPFVFLYPNYEAILSVMAYSKVVIDELQMYSPEIVATILYGLKMVTDMGGKFAIVTATLPKIFTNFLRKLGVPFTEAPHVFKRLNQDGTEFLQHRAKLINSQFDYDLLIDQAKNQKGSGCRQLSSKGARNLSGTP
jgi:CRISPR-associated endonuclease/helicase Cas3